MAENLARQLIAAHLAEGDMRPGREIALKIDQVLMHDANGPLCALQLEAMGADSARVETAVAYVDHLVVEGDSRNADDHLMLESAAKRYGMWFSRGGNGISHPVHQQRFGVPGKTLLGADSHTPAAGAIGMLAIGAGGLSVSLTLAGEPFRIPMPEIWGVRLTGSLPDWVSAKDIILELLRRHGVSGGNGRIVEYHGSGVAALTAMDRHVIANMGVEMGAVTTVFPSDEEIRGYLRAQGRERDWQPLAAEQGAQYDVADELDLSALEPLIALPSSPDRVVPVREVAGQDIHQAYIGSSANPGYRDIAVTAAVVTGKRVASGVSLDINPASRQALRQLIETGDLARLVAAGARLHQTGCNGCIGMGQAPASGRRSLRTVPRNFPGRSGAREDQVYLCSPETAAVSALAGQITDPRSAGIACHRIVEPGAADTYDGLITPPLPPGQRPRELAKTAGHTSLPDFDPIPDTLELPVLLKLGDDVDTDQIMPAGSSAMSLWNNVSAMSAFSFRPIDERYPERAREAQHGHAIVAGRNYGQGSSREHAALGPRQLGLRAVLAGSIARIHRENLINYGILPLLFTGSDDAGKIEANTLLRLHGLHRALGEGAETITAGIGDGGGEIELKLGASKGQAKVLLAGGSIPWMRDRLRDQAGAGKRTSP
jgi:aconitate hydratase